MKVREMIEALSKVVDKEREVEIIELRDRDNIVQSVSDNGIGNVIITNIEEKKSVVEKLKEYRETATEEQIIEAIRNASLGTFVGKCRITTCMGWQQEYDEQGRPLRADPNYKDSSFMIEGVEYHVTRVGWSAYIWKPGSGANYTTCWSKVRDNFLLAHVDLRPDYVKEYQEQQKHEREKDNKEA